MKPIRYLSLFSGIGGFEVGMEKSKQKFKNVGYSEVNNYAISIYSRHFPRHKALGDVTRINTEELEDFELLIAGFPCQSFSLAGKGKGFEDCRGTLFFEIARVLSDCHPKYILLENVKNLLSHEGGRTFQTILEVLSQQGYDVLWQVYNSCNYGVPQSRERLYLKGYSRRECGSEIFSQARKDFSSVERVNNAEKSAPLCNRYSEAPLKIATNTNKGYDEAYVGDGVRLAHLNSNTARFEQELTCEKCGADYCGVVGKEKYSWSNYYLIRA